MYLSGCAFFPAFSMQLYATEMRNVCENGHFNKTKTPKEMVDIEMNMRGAAEIAPLSNICNVCICPKNDVIF